MEKSVSVARHHSRNKSHLSRWTTMGIALALSFAMVGCARATQAQPPSVNEPQVTIPTPSAELDVSPLLPMMDAGKALRSADDTFMLDNYRPGIDLTYSENPAIEQIRAIQDPTARVMAAIGWLDVEHSDRFSYEKYGIYDCNGYAVDLLRLLLGNDAIGSRYSLEAGQEGMPTVAGYSFYESSTQADVEAFDVNHPFFDSHNLDWWMKTYGATYGWRQARTQAELKQMLQEGGVGLAVSSEEFIQQQHQIDPGWIGHALVVFDTQIGFGISQATNNYNVLRYAYDSPYVKVNPERTDVPNGTVPNYDFWVHTLPPAVAPAP